MKLTVLQENLNKTLVTASRGTAARATLPILGSLLLETEKGHLKISAANLETGINLWVGAKIEEEGAVAIPAKVLTEFVSALPPGKIEIQASETKLNLQSGGFNAEINGFSATEFPKTDKQKDSEVSFEFEISDVIFNQSVAVSSFAAAADDGRPVLTGVLLQIIRDEISLIATDGFRLSIKKLTEQEVKLKSPKNFETEKIDLIIPAKSLQEAVRVLKDKSGKLDEEKSLKVKIYGQGKLVGFESEDFEMYTRLIDGGFPNFERIIPKSSATKAFLPFDEFHKAVKVAGVFARESASIVKLTFEDGRLTVSANTAQIGSNKSVLDLKIEGENNEIAYNCRYLLDLLNNIEAKELVFEMSDPTSPGVFKIADDPNFLHIIMPVRVQE